MQKITVGRFPGDRIKEERIRLGFKSQAQAAERFGVTRETWSRYETDKLEMGQDVFSRFIDAGADAGYIVTGLHGYAELSKTALTAAEGLSILACLDAGKSSSAFQALLSKSEAALLGNYRAASKEGKKAIEATAVAVTKLQASR